MECNKICPVCGAEKKEKNKYCSYACRNIIINKNRNYKDPEFLKNLCKGKLDSGKSFNIKSNSRGIFKEKKYYCSRSCSNKKIHTMETKIKISISVKKFIKEHGECGAVKVKYKSDEFDLCKNCDKEIKKNLRRIFCSLTCKHTYGRKNHNEYQLYKSYTKFTFNLNDYKDEFDFLLVEKYGWYKAKNYGDNLNGVSRDHMFSVYDGFKFKINPLLISYPANCKLLLQCDNSKKYWNSSITIEQLMDRIQKWESVYGKYYKFNLYKINWDRDQGNQDGL
jgi:hypothetical protein